MSLFENTHGHILPMMTLREVVIFPGSITPLFVGRDISIRAIEESISSYKKHIFLVTQREADIEKPNPEDLYPIGVVSRILQLMRLPDGNIKVLFEGLYRATWDTLEGKEDMLVSHNYADIPHDFPPLSAITIILALSPMKFRTLTQHLLKRKPCTVPFMTLSMIFQK